MLRARLYTHLEHVCKAPRAGRLCTPVMNQVKHSAHHTKRRGNTPAREAGTPPAYPLTLVVVVSVRTEHDRLQKEHEHEREQHDERVRRCKRHDHTDNEQHGEVGDEVVVNPVCSRCDNVHCFNPFL